jgi:hypothetical protein
MGKGEEKRETIRVTLPAGFDIRLEFVEPPDVAGQSEGNWLAEMGCTRTGPQDDWNYRCNKSCR